MYFGYNLVIKMVERQEKYTNDVAQYVIHILLRCLVILSVKVAGVLWYYC